MNTEEKINSEEMYPESPENRTGYEINPGGLTGEKKRSRRKRVFIILTVLLLLTVGELIRSNNYIQAEEFTFFSNDLPKSFDGFRIVQVSDIHNRSIGGLVDKIRDQNPDIIVITGDVADAIRTDTDRADELLIAVSEVAPCYLVWGNHDMDISGEERTKMRECCVRHGIRVLENSFVRLEKGGESILIAGTDSDPDSRKFTSMMESFPKGEEFVIWLHHYPEDFERIIESSESAGSRADLVFAGHAHGGLIRPPFIGGLYAPGQGIFPKYTSGQYNEGESTMFVSRGVGNSGYTLRFLDTFHLVVCELKSGKM